MEAFWSGLLLGLSLILAIGAQNAFVLKQGLQKKHVFWVCLICAFSDAILIYLGIFGLSNMINQLPLLESIARYAGFAFLAVYGVQSLFSAWTKEHTLQAAAEIQSSPWKTCLTCLAFTWLNPHVYLDTVFLLGTISSQYEGHKSYFAAGAISASFVFFFSLGYGARVLTPFFSKASSWKILETVVGIIMLTIAFNLLF
ncbi:LysE/ArgO family amino acid transporter [Psychromonas sp. MME2]|uniref:LysE/ArgO family amino acid transporter n=1 Tax=unclassified Psychromonas TaxID=2614957 RepID=UPI00339BDD42